MTEIRVSDYVVDFLAERGVSTVYLVAGGGIMHLLDSLAGTSDIRYICNRHEQACAISAEGHARVTGLPGVCFATTGPGAANAASGILGAWADSVPLLVISGQVKRELMADFSCLRQKGPQEGDILGTVGPVTKFACSVTDPGEIRGVLERAWNACTEGRPGPAWVEIPLDVQGSLVDPSSLAAWEPVARTSPPTLSRDVTAAAAALRRASRPLVVGGAGVRLSGAEHAFRRFLTRFGLPAVVPDSGKELLGEDDPLHAGVFGPAAQRRGNFAVQNADCLLVLGASLCAKKLGFAYDDFARNAVKIVVDIDPGQLEHQVVRPDIAINSDVGDFLHRFDETIEPASIEPDERWMAAIDRWRAAYPPVDPTRYAPAPFVDAYAFVEALSEATEPTDVLVTGNGLDSVAYVQAFRLKEGQRSVLNSDWGAMGWDLPLAVGACAGSGRRTVCITGDGSIQMNIQELGTIGHYDLPVTVFVLNNEGYATIRATQRNLFAGRLAASGVGTGVDNPDFSALAKAFGLGYSCIRSNQGLREEVATALSHRQPHLCEVVISPEQEIEPRSVATRLPDGTLVSRPLEDMTPLLPRDELEDNMHLFDDPPGPA